MLDDRSSPCHTYAVRRQLHARPPQWRYQWALCISANRHSPRVGAVRTVAQNCIESRPLSREGGGLPSRSSFPLWVTGGKPRSEHISPGCPQMRNVRGPELTTGPSWFVSASFGNPGRPFRKSGTEGSNPLSSSGESRANLIFGAHPIDEHDRRRDRSEAKEWFSQESSWRQGFEPSVALGRSS
jgi:hypothetical protein